MHDRIINVDHKDAFCARRLKFKSTSTTDSEYDKAKLRELLFSRPRSQSDHDITKGCELSDSSTPSLGRFIGMELTRNYVLQNEEDQYSARREKVYSFMKIPVEVEKFMGYGFLQCADSFLFVYTFLPIRVVIAVWIFLTHPFFKCFGVGAKRRIRPAETCDLLKASILVVCSGLMFYIDTSMMYHLIKSQSVIKLYIFYNMLEVGDRLFSAFGQDIIDALFWTATETKDSGKQHLGVIPHLIFAVIYVYLHGLLVLCQATTLNVAINSSNKSLLTIMMSNNFVELKGSVFKKFDKNNLFQVACSDVRERFHLFVLLFVVVLQTMKEYVWREEKLWSLLYDCLWVLLSECVVDWIKHAFITRFNELPVDVYRDYSLSLAYDVAQTRQHNAFTDHSDLVARRMGFIPLPLGVVMVRVLASAISVQTPSALFLVLLGFLCLTSTRIINSIFILGKACDLISEHHEKTSSSESSRIRIIRDIATSPIHPPSSNTKSNDHFTNAVNENLGVAPIFSNSTVNINDVCLNKELLREEDENPLLPEPTSYSLKSSQTSLPGAVLLNSVPTSAGSEPALNL
ncbi:unnamed protein product [Bemisia tabaci]|uniref:Uncharacterized protein n=1 Tax=Bemisia tabaci TaxID=7038 RepID=A0A9P0CDC3_BEMTA|nr:unnamed protein product [Bemisia tabaci]